MAIEIYATTPPPPPIIAADAACDVVVPGVPSSYDDEDTTRDGTNPLPITRGGRPKPLP